MKNLELNVTVWAFGRDAFIYIYIFQTSDFSILDFYTDDFKYRSTVLSYDRLLMSDFKPSTANAKDSEVIKKVHGFWVIQKKN